MIERGDSSGRGGGVDLASRIDRVPPHHLEAEQAVLGSILLDGETMGMVVPILKAEDFYRGAHARIYEVMQSLYEQGDALDVILVRRECERQGLLSEVGDEILAELANVVRSPAHAEHYANIVREKAIARSLIHVASEITQAAFADDRPGADLMELAESKVFELGDARESTGATDVRSLLNETFEEIERGDGVVEGVLTGYYQFDDYTSGLRPGELIIIAGRPSMGKSSFALNVALNAAVHGGKSCAIFSLEMTAQNIVKNMLCAKSGVPGQKMRRGGRFIGQAERERLQDAAGPMFESRLFVDDTPSLTPMMLRAKCRRLKAQHGLDLVMIDYLQLMEARGGLRGIDNRQQEISYISRSLKGLARELQVPVIALSQLNRDAEKREGNKPKLSDLRECVVGETLVTLADGRRLPIASLVGETPTVLALDAHRKLHAAVSDKVWLVGRKPVFRVALASGREITCTARHRLLGPTGWQRVGDLRVGDALAVARLVPAHAAPPARESDLKCGGHAAGQQPRPEFAPVASAASALALAETDAAVALVEAEGDLLWDAIAAIEPAGEQDVYDLTVPGPANWLADTVVSHNSGAIEQDADVICLLYRSWYYSRKEPEKLDAEVIIAKQRNGPTGTVKLHFRDEFMRFENPAPQGMA